MRRLGGLGLALALALTMSACASQSPVSGSGTPDGANVGPTPCGGSAAWPPLGYQEALPAGVHVTASGPSSARVVNSGATAVSLRVSAWGLGSCTGWLTFSPDQRATLGPGEGRDFTVADPNSGIPYRIAVEVWTPACAGGCSGALGGFWSGPLTQP